MANETAVEAAEEAVDCKVDHHVTGICFETVRRQAGKTKGRTP